jgi:serralysin
MKSKSVQDLQDSSDSAFNAAGDGISANVSDLGDPSTPPSAGPVVTPVLSAETVESEAAQSGPVTPVALTAGNGITINLLFDAAAMAAPASFRAGIEQAAMILSNSITDKITVNLKIDYSGTGGGASAGPDEGQFVNYATVRSDLINRETPGDTTFNALPSGSTIQGQSNVAVWNAQLKLFGLLGANDTTTDDGSATFATDINPNLLVGVALHELTHALGRVTYGEPDGPQPDIFDFYRFTSAGTRLFTDNLPAAASYFSLDGGNTKIADYGQSSDPSDFLNPPGSTLTTNDSFNEFYNNNTVQQLTTIDLKELDALGFHVAVAGSPTPIVIESLGSTSLVQVGSNYYLDNNSTGTGPELKYGGAPVTTGEFVVPGVGTWTMIGVEQTSTGYEVAGNIPGTNEFSVWSTDSSGNYTGNYFMPGSGTSSALESLETSFHQDLNGDGVIGVTPTNVIESFGSTSLIQVGSNYYLDNNGTGIGPELQYGGAPVVTGEFVVSGVGTWTMIGVEQTSTGYEVAGNIPGTNEFSVWSTDSNGNYTGNYFLPGSGNSSALESLETSFHQDLNGDGVIGVTPTNVIESFGSTSLIQVSNNYYLDNNSTGIGPELKYGGAPVVTGEFVVPGTGTWTMIGVEQTSTGYEVAGHIPGTNEYSVWSTDSSGNYTGNYFEPGPGNSTALESLEPSFHQDLNGDGVIGVPAGQANSAAAPTPASQTSPVSQTSAVTVASNDTFVFGSGGGAVADSAGAAAIHLDVFSSVAASQYAALFHDAQPGPPVQATAAVAGQPPLASVANPDASAYADPASHVASAVLHDFHLVI